MKRTNIDKILDRPRTNLLSESKLVSANWWILYVFPIIFLLFIFADYFTANQAIILGIVGATTISFLILFVTLNNEKRADFRSARKSARILSEILQSIYSQIERINNGAKYPIEYPENWIEFYANCAIYLQYDYFEYLLLEFDIVKKINYCITAGDEAGLKKLIEFRRKTITDWTWDFDIITVSTNLAFFSFGSKELEPWKLTKEYINFMDFFWDHYSEKVKDLTVEYLRECGGQCETNDAGQYVMVKLRQEAALSTGKYNYIAAENKVMSHAIFKVYLSLNTDDKFNLCWGELTLKS